jgi:hypothetical protein
MNQHLSFIDSGKAAGGKARARTGLGKSDRPGSQGGLRKRGTMVGRANPLRYRKRVNGSNSPKVKRAVFLSRPHPNKSAARLFASAEFICWAITILFNH